MLQNILPGDEIICPSLTFVATVNAIRYMQAIPIFADISSLDMLVIDPENIRKNITSKTRGIIVMHYGGFACDMNSIKIIAKQFNLWIIEDACHGPLSEYRGKKLGTIGDIGCFSFFANKNISTGEGGMLVTNNKELNDKARLLRSHGMTSQSYERSTGHSTDYDVVELGYNYRMDDIHAAIGLVQLSKLNADLELRRNIRNIYIQELSMINGITIPFKEYPEISSNYIFVILLTNSDSSKRNKIRTLLANDGIQTSVHYPAVHRFSIYKDFYKDLPFTDYVSNNVISLPMHSKLKHSQITAIAESIQRALK